MEADQANYGEILKEMYISDAIHKEINQLG